MNKKSVHRDLTASKSRGWPHLLALLAVCKALLAPGVKNCDHEKDLFGLFESRLGPYTRCGSRFLDEQRVRCNFRGEGMGKAGKEGKSLVFAQEVAPHVPLLPMPMK